MRPLHGTQQASLPVAGEQPTVRSRALVHWRAIDGTLAPLTRHTASLGLRAGAATVYDSNGTAITLPRAAAAFSAEDWDGDSVREELLLRLGALESLDLYDADFGAVRWPVRALTLFHEFIWLGAGPLWSLTNDAISDAHLRLDAESDGTIRWRFHNGTSAVQSVVGTGLSTGARCSVRAHFHADGKVQTYLVANAGAELSGAASAAHTPAATWGGGTGVKVRINGVGDSTVGVQAVRTSAVYAGLATRYELERVL